MVDWTDGYLSDVTYPVEFYRQTTPAWLALAALLSGYRPPRIDGKFRWCDLGCGQGVTALGVAACHPRAEVFGFDFNPAHINNAQAMAAAAGVDNVVFTEASFEELAGAAPGDWPRMDFIVLHGVWSWVSTTQRAHLLAFIRNHLAPGGMVYIGYNALAGWAAMLPVQRVMRLMSEIEPGPGEETLARGMAFVQELIGAQAAYFQGNPVVANRLAFLGGQDKHYLTHELLHASWDPTPFDAVARDMAEAKCGFIGSATLLENLDVFAVPPGVVPLLAAQRDVRMREAVRDLGAARTFRRDLYQRGAEKAPAGEIAARLDEIVLTGLGYEDTGEIKIHTWGDNGLGLRMDVYRPVLQALAQASVKVRDLRRSLGDGVVIGEVLSVLVATDMAHPTPSLEPGEVQWERTAALNRVIARHNCQGGAVPLLLAPRLGTALMADAIETMIVAAYGDGERGPLIERLLLMFMESGRSLFHDGQPISDIGQARTAWGRILDGFMAKRLGLFQRAGVL